jgi:hypothetical protein
MELSIQTGRVSLAGRLRRFGLRRGGAVVPLDGEGKSIVFRTGGVLACLLGLEAVCMAGQWLPAAVIAQANSLSEGASLIGQLGVSGFLAWYCYYVTSAVIPRIEAQFQATLAKQQDQFQATLDKQQGCHREEQQRTRDHYEKVVDRMLDEHKQAIAQTLAKFPGPT